ncbi:hypothetical protein ASE92_12565 [Pedobacter sp. Leaf41]|uniref:hypothetical protein n=1 Tax=Pedobacter sp. Leaf41 TaxID=1736218 RepID=UPI000703602F|nr:hypothetical protein [Pedobacter sp. Leaf41]KQN34425.1 hypothetical protein ASE92_12565 [Pedobacter sp. Leaf41]
MKITPLISTAILLIVALLTFTSCNNKEKPIHILTTNVVGMDEKQIRKDTTITVESEYFEVKLSSVSNGEFYVAGKQLLKPKIGEEFKTEFFKIVDEQGKELEFKTPTDFLNFMSKAGYDLKEQEKQKFGIDYTFKKKS